MQPETFLFIICKVKMVESCFCFRLDQGAKAIGITQISLALFGLVGLFGGADDGESESSGAIFISGCVLMFLSGVLLLVALAKKSK